MVNTPTPLSDTDVKTRPRTPNGANWMIHFTVCDTTSAKSCTISIVFLLATFFIAKPNTIAQNRMPR